MSFICIADDDASICSGVGNLVKSAAYAARLFASGKELLVSTAPEDALCRLPGPTTQGMQGLDVRRQPIGEQQIRARLVSAHEDEAVGRGLQRGAMALLRQLFAEDALHESTMLAIERHGEVM